MFYITNSFLYLQYTSYSMMQKSQKQIRLEKRNNRIRERFNFLTSKKHLSTTYTLEQLAEEFLPLTQETIWLIVSKTGFYK